MHDLAQYNNDIIVIIVNFDNCHSLVIVELPPVWREEINNDDIIKETNWIGVWEGFRITQTHAFVRLRKRGMQNAQLIHCVCWIFSALKIHLSSEAHAALSAFPGYITDFRGETLVQVLTCFTDFQKINLQIDYRKIFHLVMKNDDNDHSWKLLIMIGIYFLNACDRPCD